MSEAAALFEAIRTADLKGIRELLKTNPSLIQAFDDQGHTPLHKAAQWYGVVCLMDAAVTHELVPPEQQQSMAAKLEQMPPVEDLEQCFMEFLGMGISANVRGKDGGTPLHACADVDGWHAAELLLERGADVDARDGEGETPLHRAARERPAPWFALGLIDKGADPNARSNNGMTPLHCAALEGHVEVVRALLDAGAQIDAIDDEPTRETPLVYAIFCEDVTEGVPVIQLLLERGADLKAGKTRSLDATALASNIPAFELLLPHFGDIRSSTWADELTPLHFASGKGHLEMMQYLLEKGADPNPVAGNAGTPLDLATMQDQHGAVELLQKWGGKTHTELPDQGQPSNVEAESPPEGPDVMHIGEVIWSALESDPRVVMDRSFLQDLDLHMGRSERWLAHNLEGISQQGYGDFEACLRAAPDDRRELLADAAEGWVECIGSTGTRVIAAGNALADMGGHAPQDLVEVNRIMERAMSAAVDFWPNATRCAVLGDFKLRLARAGVPGYRPTDAAPWFRRAIELDPECQAAEIAARRLGSIERHPTEVAPAPEAKKSGCYIATACYGSYEHPDVMILRRFRDRTLLRSRIGSGLVRWYYAVSPRLADRLGRKRWLAKGIRRLCLEPLVRLLDSEHADQEG